MNVNLMQMKTCVLNLFGGIVFFCGYGCCVANGADDSSPLNAVDSVVVEAFSHARIERVAVVGIGDSNQRFGGHGWSAAMSAALSKEFGCYGSSLVFFRYDEKEDETIPAHMNASSFGGWFLPEGRNHRPDWRNGRIVVPADHPLDVKGHLRFHLWYGAFPGATVFSPAIRHDEAPWKILEKVDAPVQAVSDVYSLAHFQMDLAADPERNFPLLFSVVPMNTEIEGPFFGSAIYAENTDKKNGIAYHTLYGVGGQSLYDMLKTIRDVWGQNKVGAFFKQVQSSLNGSGRCIVMITSGLNDRNEKDKSIGSKGGFEGSSNEAYEDNLEGLTMALNKFWVAAGGNPEMLTVVYMPSHPVSEERHEDMLIGYRTVARKVASASPQRGYIMLPALTNQPFMAENGYYDKGSETNPHLSKKGYQELSNLVVKTIAGK